MLLLPARWSHSCGLALSVTESAESAEHQLHLARRHQDSGCQQWQLAFPGKQPRQHSTPNMTGRRFHRTMEMIPARPWWSKSPSFPPLLNKKTKYKTRERKGHERGTSSIRFHCPVPRSSSHIGQGNIFQNFDHAAFQKSQVSKRGWRAKGAGESRSFLCQRFRPLFCALSLCHP